MRFPFRFMGLLSVAVAAWIAYYVVAHPPQDAVVLGLEVVPALGLAGFGGWLLIALRQGRA
jgi:hypothetical protein